MSYSWRAALLRALAYNPAGLSTPELARLCASDVKTWRLALQICGRELERQEKAGRVQRVGVAERRAVIWRITDAGRPYADSIPAGLSGWCYLVLGMLGRPAGAVEIQQWLENDGLPFTTSQVYYALHNMSRKTKYAEPLTEKGGEGLWRLTERGRALLAETADDG